MKRWEIVYDDGSTYSNEDGPPEEARTWGVIYVVTADPEVGRAIMGEWDFYTWWGHWDQDNQWYGQDVFGLNDYLRRPGWKLVLLGGMVSNARYRELYEQALALEGFEPKSGRRRAEPWPLID